MSALPHQPVPTIAQRKALRADHAKRYARQYRDVQEAVTDFQVARLRYEAERLSRQPEPCQFCAVEVEDESVPALSEDFVITVLGVAALIVLAILAFLGAPA